jgi:hypothetical protein
MQLTFRYRVKEARRYACGTGGGGELKHTENTLLN